MGKFVYKLFGAAEVVFLNFLRKLLILMKNVAQSEVVEYEKKSIKIFDIYYCS